MKRIYKYPLSIAPVQTLGIPAGATLLTVQTQRNQPCLWALVDPERLQEEVRLRMVGTGHEFEDADQWEYLGSFQLDAGMLVFHVFRQVR